MQTSGCLILSSICLIIELITSIYLKILMASTYQKKKKILMAREKKTGLEGF
jgi:hypothetical protein